MPGMVLDTTGLPEDKHNDYPLLCGAYILGYSQTVIVMRGNLYGAFTVYQVLFLVLSLSP